MAAEIEIHDLTVHYHHKPVLWAVDCGIPYGSLCAVVGPNGAGKSTLLKAIMGLVPLASGDVRFAGKTLEAVRSSIAYVPQKEEVDWDFPVTVFEVVLMGRYGHLRFWQRPSRKDRELAEQALEQLGIADLRDRQISALSGGQQQRVFLARALCQQAQIYFLDEPFSGIDAATEEEISALFLDLREQGKTIVCVHHDLHTVFEWYDWTLLLNLRLIAAGDTESVFTPEQLKTAYGGRNTVFSRLIGRMQKERWKGRETSERRD